MNTIFCINAFSDNYIWLLVNWKKKTAAVVDPGDATPVIGVLTEKQLVLKDILITHHHSDHVGGIEALVSAYGADVYGPKAENIPSCRYPLIEADKLHLKSIDAEFKILELPGHTSGHIAYYGDSKVFCGDTLFAGGCGRLFEGTAEQMLNSLNKLKALPKDTAVYCAHEYTEKNLAFAKMVDEDNPALLERIEWTKKYRANKLPTVPSTIGIEKATNPFLRADSDSIRKSAEIECRGRLDSELAIFAAIRKMKDRF